MPIYAIYTKLPDGSRQIRELRKAINKQSAQSAAAAAFIEAESLNSEKVAELLSTWDVRFVAEEPKPEEPTTSQEPSSGEPEGAAVEEGSR